MGKVKTSFVLPSDLYAELKVKDLILEPFEGAGPEDFSEYGGEDID